MAPQSSKCDGVGTSLLSRLTIPGILCSGSGGRGKACMNVRSVASDLELGRDSCRSWISDRSPRLGPTLCGRGGGVRALSCAADGMLSSLQALLIQPHDDPLHPDLPKAEPDKKG